MQERTLDCVTIPRSDTDGSCEFEVTVTSEHTHKQKAKEIDKAELLALEAKTKTRTKTLRMVLKHGSVPGESGCGRRPECTGQRLARTTNQG